MPPGTSVWIKHRSPVRAYAITSLTFAQASPARLADLLRGQWAIEVCQAGCAYGM
jgi:hypothetical protein